MLIFLISISTCMQVNDNIKRITWADSGFPVTSVFVPIARDSKHFQEKQILLANIHIILLSHKKEHYTMLHFHFRHRQKQKSCKVPLLWE